MVIFGSRLDLSWLQVLQLCVPSPSVGCGGEGGNGIYKWNLSTAELRSAAVHEALACALLQPAAPTSAVYVPTQITKPVKVAQTKLVLGAGTRSGFGSASCNCPKYSKFKHLHTFFLMFADLCSIFAAASLHRTRAVHYCSITAAFVHIWAQF